MTDTRSCIVCDAPVECEPGYPVDVRVVCDQCIRTTGARLRALARELPCEVCGGDSYVMFNYGHTVNPDGTLGGRGIRSIPCHACAPNAS